MTTRPASQIAKGDLLIFKAGNGRTRARVQSVVEGTEADLVNPEDAPSDPRPMLHIHVLLQRAVFVPDVPRWKTVHWTLHHFPEDEVELCQLQDATRW